MKKFFIIRNMKGGPVKKGMPSSIDDRHYSVEDAVEEASAKIDKGDATELVIMEAVRVVRRQHVPVEVLTLDQVIVDPDSSILDADGDGDEDL